MNISVLNIAFKQHDTIQQLHPTLIESNGQFFLTDTGYEETLPQLRAALQQKGIDIINLTGILISHDDIDHLGALYDIKKMNPLLQVYCSKTEAPSVTGKIEAERLAQAKQLLQQLPEEQQAWGKDFVALQESIQRISEVDHIVQDNDLILGSIRVIETPGHTRGHISLYIDASKTLIANDAVVAEPDGELNIANPEFTLDLPAAVRSVQKIRDLDIEQLICFHGGIITDHIRQKLDHLIERYKN
jgi:glyoxylase-like metal-dependent hydrolase (beta-lactamase superfamily II)